MLTSKSDCSIILKGNYNASLCTRRDAIGRYLHRWVGRQIGR